MPDKPVALVTGGAKRVGRAIVLSLADAGYDVAFTFNSSAGDADELKKTLLDRGIKTAAISVDLTDPQPAAQLLGQRIHSEFGRLDVLVNNASLYLPGNLAATTAALMRRLWAIHVEAPLLLCQVFAPLLRSAGGHVINMVDLLAEHPLPQYMAYSASKAALANLTLSLARELAPEVTVNGIAPGVVEWPADLPQAQRDQYLQRVPLARAGTPEDVANLVRFLISTGNYITGQILRLDGGRSTI